MVRISICDIEDIGSNPFFYLVLFRFYIMLINIRLNTFFNKFNWWLKKLILQAYVLKKD
jgi:hypothetical protein